MATTMKKKPRIAISVDKATEEILKLAARHDEVTVASKAAELMKIGLEMEEDHYWGTIAEERLKNSPDRYIPHDEFWKLVRSDRGKKK